MERSNDIVKLNFGDIENWLFDISQWMLLKGR